jgi:hypothetical protein
MNTINEILQSRFISKNYKPRFIYKLLYLRYKKTKMRYYELYYNQMINYCKNLEMQYYLQELIKYYVISKSNN